jgi:ATP-dependent protease ClpP protease subunit
LFGAAPAIRNASTDTDQMRKDHEAALAALLLAFAPVDEEWIVDLGVQIEQAINAADTAALAALSLDSTRAATVVRTALVSAAQQAADRMADEARRQGVTVTAPLVTGLVTAIASAVATLIASNLASTASQEAVRRFLPGVSAAEVADAVKSMLRIRCPQREQADKLRAQHGVEAQSWYRITNAADPDEAEVMLYDEVGGWYGATADQFIADLRGITSPNLRVRVNSPGGSVFEGIAIANALRSHPANVTVQVDGIAASIASVIAMAGDRIEMAPNTMMMIHDASGVCLGNASDMEEMAELLDLISDNIADAYASRAGGTRDEWREAMRAETWYLPDDAVDRGPGGRGAVRTQARRARRAG